MQLRESDSIEDDPLYDVSTHTRPPVAVVIDVGLPIVQVRLARSASAIAKLQALIVQGHSQNIFVYFVAHSAFESDSEIYRLGLQWVNVALCQSDRPNRFLSSPSRRRSAVLLPPAPISSLEELHLPELSIAWHQAVALALDAQRANVNSMVKGENKMATTAQTAQAIISHIESDRSYGTIEAITAYRDPETEVEVAIVEHPTSGYCYVASSKFWEIAMNINFPVCASGYAKLEKALSIYRDIKGFQ